MSGEQSKAFSRKDAKAAKNGRNKEVCRLNSRHTGFSLRALRLCEKRVKFLLFNYSFHFEKNLILS
jgi:hypothetical protein